MSVCGTGVHIVQQRFFLAVALPALASNWPGPCGTPTSSRVTDSTTASRAFNLYVRCGNINPLSIVYAFRPWLRSRLTLGGITFPRKPQTYGEQDFHLLYRYSCRHTHLLPLQPFFRSTFTADSNAPLPIQLLGSRGFGEYLIPVHLRRFKSRPVSYYALFKWWLLLSQHPGCHGIKTSSITKIFFGALAGDQGCFPFDLGGYPPRSYSRGTRTGIRSLIEAGSLAGP